MLKTKPFLTQQVSDSAINLTMCLEYFRSFLFLWTNVFFSLSFSKFDSVRVQIRFFVLLTGELKQIGCCMDRYWQMKKILAPGCETAAITSLMVALRPFVYGISMAGAGGGGFLYALARDSRCKKSIGEMLKTFQVNYCILRTPICSDNLVVKYLHNRIITCSL